jgi:hypothetical protein
VKVNVTESNFLGTRTNTLPVGALKTGNGSNSSPASATLTFNGTGYLPPTLSKYFTPYTNKEGGVSILSIFLNNPNSTAAKLTAPFTDNFPTGLFVSGNGSDTCGGVVTAVPGSTKVILTGGSIPAKGFCKITVGVTDKTFLGMFTNIIPAGSLKTGVGSNNGSATATVQFTVSGIAPPRLTKSFNPTSMKDGGISLLTITLYNSAATAAKLTAPLVDTFPSGVLVSGNASNTCGGTVTALAGSSSVTLTGGTIPINGSCKVTVDVTTQNCTGARVNKLAVGSLKTGNGNNTVAASATLTLTN